MGYCIKILKGKGKMLKNIRYETLDRALAILHHQTIINLIIEMHPRQYWDFNNLLKELPGKWFFSNCSFDYGGQLVGVLIASKKSINNVHIHKFVISKSLRNVGIGSEMLNKLMKLCINNEIKYLTLYVYKDNIDGRRFYLEKGFYIKYDEKTDLGNRSKLEYLL